MAEVPPIPEPSEAEREHVAMLLRDAVDASAEEYGIWLSDWACEGSFDSIARALLKAGWTLPGAGRAAVVQELRAQADDFEEFAQTDCDPDVYEEVAVRLRERADELEAG